MDLQMLRETGFILRLMIEESAQKKADDGATSEEIAALSIAFPIYKQNRFHKAGVIETDPETRQPFKNRFDYDGSVQVDWNLSTPSVWIPYHSTNPKRPFKYADPTCAEDMYLKGQVALFEGGVVRRAIVDTSYSPEVMPNHWEIVEVE